MSDLVPAPDSALDLSQPAVVVHEARSVARKLWTAADYFETVAYDIGVHGGDRSRGIDAGLDEESRIRRKEQLALIREARESRKAAKEFVAWAMELDAMAPNASGADVEESDVLKRAREMRAKLAEESAA